MNKQILHRILLLSVALFFSTVLSAQADDPDPQPTHPSWWGEEAIDTTGFSPYWYVLPQIGVSMHYGEGDVFELLSPSVAVSGGWQFHKLLGVRVGFDGFHTYNYQARPKRKYQWDYLQLHAVATLSLIDLFAGYDSERKISAYTYLGGGATMAFNNDDANMLAKNGGNFEKVWDGTKTMLMGRFGLGADYAINDLLMLNAEFAASMLPDSFNSKIGNGDNLDWQFQLLVGLKVMIK